MWITAQSRGISEEARSDITAASPQDCSLAARYPHTPSASVSLPSSGPGRARTRGLAAAPRARFSCSPHVLTGEDSSGEALCFPKPQPRLPGRRGGLIPGGCDFTGHSVFGVDGEQVALVEA